MKIVIVGQDSTAMKNIKYDLSDLQDGDMPLKMETARPSQINMVLDRQTKILILDLPKITNVVFQFIVQVRKTGFEGPIILVGALVPSFDKIALTQTKNLHFIERPYVPKHFVQQVKSALTVQEMAQRKSKRFDVYHPALVESYNSDFKGETVVNNISRGGLRMEGALAGLKTGDLIKIHMNFDELQKERIMSARVVWLKKESDNKEQAGLEFVSQKVIYDYLLSYALN